MASNYHYILKMKDALNEGDLVLCYETILEFLDNNATTFQSDQIVELKSSRASFDENKNVESFDVFQKKLDCLVNTIADFEDLRFEEEYSKDKKDENETIVCEPDKQHLLPVGNRLIDLEIALQTFLSEWIGKVKVSNTNQGHEKLTTTLTSSIFSDSQDDIQISDADFEQKSKIITPKIEITLDLQAREVCFMGWGEGTEFDQFFTNVKGWWEREIIEKGIVKVFVSYSHLDKKWKDALITALAVQWQEKRIELWHDREIEGGEEWKDKILSKLGEAHIILLLISPEFTASEFCYKTETSKALDQHKKQK